jgi:hypothetical protein
MCDVSDYAIGIVLGQIKDKKPIWFKYFTIENELLVLVFACEKFRSYFVGLPIVFFCDRPRSCRVIYYINTPALGRIHESFDCVICVPQGCFLFIFTLNYNQFKCPLNNQVKISATCVID